MRTRTIKRQWTTGTFAALAGFVLAALVAAGVVLGAARTLTFESATTAGATATDIQAHTNSVSADGSTVFFSTRQNLIPADDDGRTDVYRRTGGVTFLISQAGTNPQGPAQDAGFLARSADGSRVFFGTPERLDGNADTDQDSDIYERTGSATVLVSRKDPSGTGPSGHAFFEDASTDGSTVVFATEERLVGDDTNSLRDLYIRASGTTTLVTKAEAGQTRADSSIDFHHVSANGNQVVFETVDQMRAADTDSEPDLYAFSPPSTLTLLTPGTAAQVYYVGASVDGTKVFFDTDESVLGADTDTKFDVYRVTNGTTTELMTVAGSGAGAEDHHGFTGATADGSKIFFETLQAMNAADTDSVRDVYSGTAGTAATRISVAGADAPTDADEPAFFAAASDNGNRVFWRSEQQMTDSDADSITDIFATEAGDTVLASAAQDQTGPVAVPALNRIATDGSSIIFSTTERLAVEDTDTERDLYSRDPFAVTPETRLISEAEAGRVGPDSEVTFSGASDNGQVVAFDTEERLVGADVDGLRDSYQRKLGETLLVSGAASGAPANDFRVAIDGLSADGSKVLLRTDQNLLPSDADGYEDVYLRSGGQTTLLVPSNGSAAPGEVWTAAAATDFSTVIVKTWMRLTGGDTDMQGDLYAVAGGQITLITPGTTQDVTPLGASTDATRVVFSTEEGVDAGDMDGLEDLYLGSPTQPVLLTPGTTNYDVTYRDISKNGLRVFFESRDEIAGSSSDGDTQDVFMREATTTTWISQVGGGVGDPNDDAYFADTSDDGSVVAFNSYSSFTDEDHDTELDVYRRAGTETKLVSQPEVAGTPTGADFAGISGDGARIFFRTTEALIPAQDQDGGKIDIYERSGNTTTLTSVTEAGGTDNDHVFLSGISADGAHVYLDTGAPMTAGDTDGGMIDVYDRSGGQTTLISAAGSGAAAPAGHVAFAFASSDGSRVILTTQERLTGDDLENEVDVYERADGTTTLVSPAPEGSGGPPGITPERFSTDARVVALTTLEQLLAADTDNQEDVYLSRLPAPTQTDGGTTTTEVTATTTETASTPAPTGTTTTPTGTTTTPTAAPRCVVPKLKGLTLRQVKTKLRRARCRLGRVTRRRAAARSRGKVIAQKPKPRTRRARNFRVAVTLGR